VRSTSRSEPDCRARWIGHRRRGWRIGCSADILVCGFTELSMCLAFLRCHLPFSSPAGGLRLARGVLPSSAAATLPLQNTSVLYQKSLPR